MHVTLQVVDGYFVHYFAPGSLPAVPKNVVFVIDVSGSMQGHKMTQTKQAMVAILDDLHSEDTFNILTFNDHVTKWSTAGLVRVDETNIESAKQFVNSLEADYCNNQDSNLNYSEVLIQRTYLFSLSATNIDSALVEALRELQTPVDGLQESRPGLVIFLTDGQPSAGETNLSKYRNITHDCLTGSGGFSCILSLYFRIKQNARDSNRGETALFSLGFGDDVEFQFLTSLSLQNYGFSRKIYTNADAVLQLEVRLSYNMRI